MTTGFAAKDASGILIQTVGESERSAKVNWLFTFGRYMVTQATSDQAINITFAACCQRYPGLELVRVEVREEAS